MEIPASKGASTSPEVQVVEVVPIREAVAPGLNTPAHATLRVALIIAHVSVHHG